LIQKLISFYILLFLLTCIILVSFFGNFYCKILLLHILSCHRIVLEILCTVKKVFYHVFDNLQYI
uniref:Ovule protein n=1 Tax=Strongyloides venezuelensis TaxID=75913 RepID=A0A0K0FLW0_STRVS